VTDFHAKVDEIKQSGGNLSAVIDQAIRNLQESYIERATTDTTKRQLNRYVAELRKSVDDQVAKVV